MRKLLVLLVALIVTSVVFADVAWVSTQFHPPAERDFVEGTLLPNFRRETGITARFLALTYEEASTRIRAEQQAQRVTVALFGDLQGGIDLMGSQGFLTDLTDVTFPDRTFIPTLEQYAYNYGIKQFVPWLQATYVMMVNKQAFEYLPAGLTEHDVRNATANWTYDALLEWVKSIHAATGRRMLGFPEAPLGLWHRFLHGHIYPSFTGAQAMRFDSLEAIAMWEYLRDLFEYVNPASSTWANMSEPLLRNEVWIAWDHTARLTDALRARPDDFVPIPGPAGPAGRGFITVLVGLSIPKGAPNTDEAVELMGFLTSPEVQVQILDRVGFFPVVEEAVGHIPTGALKFLAEGVVAQSGAEDALMAFIPGLGPLGGEFTETYRLAFTRIVRDGEDIVKVLTELAPDVRDVFKEAGAPLPEPDIGYYK